MKITADTSILVRAITGDDRRQSKVAQAELARAEGTWLGAETLVSFDKEAVRLLKARGRSARLPS